MFMFPDVELADEDGLLAIGGDLEVETLLQAYKNGIFPWPIFEKVPMMWFAPPKRAVLFLDKFRFPKSLKKILKKGNYTFAIDHNFPQVIHNCARVGDRGKLNKTWLTPEITEAYIDFHNAGYAHSIECYREDILIGGLYGVAIGKMFAGESMFYKESNASKLALCYLVSFLLDQGVSWIDCQQMTPFFESLGAEEVDRKEFMQMLKIAVNQEINLFGS